MPSVPPILVALSSLGLLLSTSAWASVDPKCAALPKPADYDEIVQQDFLANYVALASTFSPVHGPIPHDPGHGAVGVRVAGIPPVGCEQRYVLDWTKTEETNKSPALPQLHASVALPAVGMVVPYVEAAYLPPVPLLGTRNVALSAAAGFGLPVGERLQLGARFHASVLRVIADVATPFSEEDPVYDDLFLSSTFGFDALAGWDLGAVTPYLALGFTDASTFFWIGDDGVVTNNYHPYAGLDWSLGVDGLVKEHLRWGAEYYGAPGGYNELDPSKTVDGSFGRYGHIHTLRLRVAWEI